MEQSQLLYAKGPYRIVAVDGREQPAVFGATMVGYAVIDSAGTPLRLETSLDDAKSWVHAQIEEPTRDERPEPSTRPRRRYASAR